MLDDGWLEAAWLDPQQLVVTWFRSPSPQLGRPGCALPHPAIVGSLFKKAVLAEGRDLLGPRSSQAIQVQGLPSSEVPQSCPLLTTQLPLVLMSMGDCISPPHIRYLLRRQMRPNQGRVLGNAENSIPYTCSLQSPSAVIRWVHS